MAANQTGLRLRFFTWEKPLLGQAVDYLMGGETANVSQRRGLDLSAQLVVVPTRQAGRRLREALATGAAARAASSVPTRLATSGQAFAATAAVASCVSAQPTMHSAAASVSASPTTRSAIHAPTQGTALFPPLVLTFDALLEVLRESSEGAGVEPLRPQASQSQVLLAWVDVLLSADLATFRAVFPVAPPERHLAWARGLAEQLAKLQDELRENDLGLVEVAAKLEPDFPEFSRWQELAELERRQCARLVECGVASPLEAQRELLARGRLPSGIERVIVLAWPDPRPMGLGFFERVAETLPVEVCVYAPESARDNFDGWGRPIPEQWVGRELRLPEFYERVRVCADPHDQAERLAEAAALYNKRSDSKKAEGDARPRFDDGSAAKAALRTSSGRAPNEKVCDLSLALGVLDAEVVRPLETALRERGVPSYNPEGRERRGDRLHQLLSALASVAHEESFQGLARLVRQPDVLHALCAGNEAEGARFLAEWDRVYEQHLPPDLRAVRTQWRGADSAGKAALARLAKWGEELRAAAFPQNVQAVLAQIFQGRRFDLEQAADAEWVAAAEAWAKCVREVAEAAPLCAALRGREAREALLDLAIERYARERVFAEKPAGAVELQGWLELIWEAAPHLVVAGLNEGKVPASVSGDLFLPESFRAKLGLKTNAQRFAVDAYYLQALAASRAALCRRHFGDAGSQTLFSGGPLVRGPSCSDLSGRTTALGGRLDILLGRVSAKGDPLKPSRLLLRCADEELPERVQFLFREPAPRAGANVAWSRAWALQLPDPSEVALPPHFPVTGLRKWLDCPLRFYLSRVLKLCAVDAAKVEMDARDFGTLCHAALEAMGREEALRGCTDEARLQRFLHEALDAEVTRIFGRRLSVPLVVQVESARQRLAALAGEQARLHAEGWRIKRVEWEFELPIGSLVFRGKIDRIDEHEESGALRVIDYKTSDSAAPPEKVHLVSPPKGEAFPAWRMCQSDGEKKPRAWADLQLPVYERVCAGAFPGRQLRCGYFNLPRAVGDTGLSLWEDYSPDLATSAWDCAEGVAAAIARREFWPPRELKGHEAERDEFATLFQRGAAESVSLGRYREEEAAL